MTTTWPQGQISTLGNAQLLENKDPHISYVGHDGSIFHLSGPMSPIIGAQNGVALVSISGLHSPFTHLDNQGARQDGATWTDSVYEVGEIDMLVETSGLTPMQSRQVTAAWMGAWDPKKQGKLCWFSPERGEWWANVRMGKSFSDQVTSARTCGQRFTWTARNDDAFWQSFDSVDTFRFNYTQAADGFNTVHNTDLGSNFIITYYGDGDGTLNSADGAHARLSGTENTQRGAIARFHTDSATDNQVITIKFSGIPSIPFFTEGGFNDIWARLDDAGNGIRLRLGFGNITISRFNGGEETVIASRLMIPPIWGEEFTFIVGASDNARTYKVLRDGFQIWKVTETGTGSSLGAGHRGWGFGMEANEGPLGRANPAPIQSFNAGDNSTLTQSGFVGLQNIGDQDAWPRYLCYGPGTFSFGDGPGSSNTITFGPLLENQVVLVTTLPRLRSVVDLSVNQVPTQQLNLFQELLEGLISFATINNVPPLLQQFESIFGIQPPQGVLYSLLTGRFTTPLPPKAETEPPELFHIPVTIKDGNADSKIVAAVTPFRRWPE